MDTKYYWDLLSGKRKRNCADDSYMDSNGIGPKMFQLLLGMLGK
ncbi:hypothetical protein [Palleniella intestinalis]|nr:hypothetical protein [Palleniella intestinalis]